MEKLRGELWEGRAMDGKLKSSLEWPNFRFVESRSNTTNHEFHGRHI